MNMIIFTDMKDAVKDALRAEKAMNKALEREKASGQAKKQQHTKKGKVVAEKI
tara:strand:- start:247 stop:405 length:159 start_codon:yes stop_codon:yes gene_type:complete